MGITLQGRTFGGFVQSATNNLIYNNTLWKNGNGTDKSDGSVGFGSLELVVRDVGNLTAADAAALAPYLADPLDTTELVFVSGGSRIPDALARQLKAIKADKLAMIREEHRRHPQPSNTQYGDTRMA